MENKTETKVTRKKIKPAQLKKIITLAVVLLIFLVVTNPALIPFLPAETKAAIGNVWGRLFGDVENIVSVLAINWASIFKLIAMILMLSLLSVIARVVMDNIHPKSGKGKSGITLLRSASNYLFALLGVFWGLSILGVSVSAILASVGVLALIIGFGAESLVSDVVTGIFLVFEDQFNVGDIIEVGSHRGTVESIGVRTTCIRDVGGNIKIINNSDIRNVLNRSRAESYATTTVGISYNCDLEKVEKQLEEILPAIREKYPDVFLEVPTYSGVQELGSSSVDLKFVAQVAEENIFKAPRIMNRELKIAFDKYGIEIPFSQVVVHKAD